MAPAGPLVWAGDMGAAGGLWMPLGGGSLWAVFHPGVLDPGLTSFLVSPPGPRPAAAFLPGAACL